MFAIGDLTALPEAKTAGAAAEHADSVTTNIRTLINGGGELASYEPGPPGVALPLGPSGGASYAPQLGVLGAEQTAQIKGADLMTGMYADMFDTEGG
ncbi:hypothetical protein [Streptomyces sp. NPDC050704]|uniref:hypothetical protein n=1 Tax=Streptomyces sp. NPDC050704 TaxID=3157219 RepID=UPI00343EDB00